MHKGSKKKAPRWLGFWVRCLDFSPIKGPEGNIEYLLFLQKPQQEALPPEETVAEEQIAGVVDSAHQSL